MINLFRAALRGVKAELAAGESGWVALSGASPLSGSGRTSVAGTMVSEETVMRLSTVWACVSRTSQLIASLPCHVHEKQRGGGEEIIEPDISQIVTTQPNRSETAPEFWESRVGHQLLRGNAYSEKLKVKDRIVGLRPLQGVAPKKRPDGRFDYHVNEAGQIRKLGPDDVFHMRGFGGGDGLGLSAVKYGVQSLGAALAADTSAASVFANGLFPSGVLESEQTLDEKQRDDLQKVLAHYAGSTKSGKTLVIEAGLKWRQTQFSPEDAQLLETRRFQVEDVCRWFGIPPIIIGHAAEGQTMWGSGVEGIMLGWLTMGINPMLRRLEARMNMDLIPSARRGRWSFKFNREAMLQMDSQAKGEFLSKMGNSGTMTANERRDKLNLPRHEGSSADDLLVQRALTTLEQLKEIE